MDLIEEASNWKQQYKHVLLAGDFNEFEYTEGRLLELQSRLGLVPATYILPQSSYIRVHQYLGHVMITNPIQLMPLTKYHI
jgi:endonuclease/exonuclease/phosphatase family metal-dependent hydrolase